MARGKNVQSGVRLPPQFAGSWVLPFDDPDEPSVFAQVELIGAVGSWRCDAWLRTDDEGRILVWKVQVTGSASRAVTTQMLRQVPLGALLIDLARLNLPQVEAQWLRNSRMTDVARSKATRASTAAQPARRMKGSPLVAPEPNGRAGFDESHYREVATMFLEVQGEQGAGMVEALHEIWNRPPGTIRYWIKKAEELHFLTPAVQGKAGRQPGSRLLNSSGEKS